MKRFFVLFLLLFTATATFSQQRDLRIDYQESSARNLEAEQMMFLSPLIADLEVSPTKICHVETEAFKDYPVTDATIQNIPGFKRVALSKAARAHQADVMVGTTIDVSTNAAGRLVITVTGYPATYRNFRIAQQSDLDLINYAKKVGDSDLNSAVLEAPQTNIEVTQ